jgi:8-oxo-dGTP diphosphatase
MAEEKQRPKVGVGVCVIKDGKILFQKRKGSHGAGSWCFPGGHLEFNESVEDCARRETMEEAGIAIKNLRPGPYTNDIMEKEGRHYITVFIIADYDAGEVRIMEPEKCEKWEWHNWNDLPDPLFVPQQNLVKQKFNPFKQYN